MSATGGISQLKRSAAPPKSASGVDRRLPEIMTNALLQTHSAKRQVFVITLLILRWAIRKRPLTGVAELSRVTQHELLAKELAMKPKKVDPRSSLEQCLSAHHRLVRNG